MVPLLLGVVSMTRHRMQSDEERADVDSTSALEKDCRVIIFGHGLSCRMKDLTWKNLLT